MSEIVSIRISTERYERLKKEAEYQLKSLGAHCKDLLENWEDLLMESYFDGVRDFVNGKIFDDDLLEHGIER